MDFLFSVLGILPFVFLLAAIGAFVSVAYVKAPPDVAYIISGITKKPRIIIGKASFKIPFFERLDKLSLRLIKVDVKTKDSVPTAEYININVDSVVMAKIPAEEEMILKASRLFLNVHEKVIGDSIVDVLEGNTREIVGSMSLREMIGDRKALGEKVQVNATPDLAAMGIELLNFTVQNFSDKNGVIEDLGIENTAQIKKTASIAKAEAERDVVIASAEAQRKAAEAKAEADKAIAEKNTEVEIRKSELKQQSESKRAEAEAAYNIQEQVQKKEQNIREVEANIAKTEKEVELQAKEAEVRERELDAEIRRQAEAEKYQKQLEAEAERYAREQQAQADLATEQRRAEAVQYAALKEAEAIRVKGEAEAKAIQAKGEAEAKAMERKAEAYRKYSQAAMLEMTLKVLPEVAKNIATPLSQIDKITIFGGENGSGVGSVAANVPQAMAYAFETIEAATGVDMKKIVAANTIDAKVNKNIKVNGNINSNLGVEVATSQSEIL